MSRERAAAAALAAMLILIFGGAPLIVMSGRVLHFGPDVAAALFAALPLVAVRVALEVLDTDTE